MQDEYGRPLSDDGQWVWDGASWRSTGAGPAAPATAGYEPTRVTPAGPQDYFAGPGQPVPSGPGRPGLPPPPTPWWKRPVTIIGALLVLSAVLITVLVLTSGSSGTKATPTPSVTVTPSVAPTTGSPSPSSSPSPSPVDTPTPSPSHKTLVPDEVEPGIYDCTQGGESTGGTISFSGVTYTTDTGAVGTYTYSRGTGAISFTGGDLGPYTGTYNPSGPSLDLQASGNSLHCAP